MKNVIIIGTGAVASELTMYLRDIPDVYLKGYLEYEYNLEKYYKTYHYKMPVLGDIDTYEPKENDYFILGVTHVGFRQKVIATMKAKGAKFYTMIHPTALIAEDAVIGEGCSIAPFCMVGPNAVIGDFNQMTSYSAISHDCRLGTNNVFSTVIVCGRVHIGDNNTFYIRSTVRPDLTIGNNNTIAAGMIVDADLQDDSTVFYKYKERIIAVPQ